MKYLVLLYADEQRYTSPEYAGLEADMAAHDAFDKVVRERAEMLGGEALAGTDTATTLGGVDGADPRPVTDGPYAETVEQLGGFYVVQARDLDEMIELCQALPRWYTLEIRPVLEVPL